MARFDAWPVAPTLVGARLQLEPLGPEHADELAPLLDDVALHTFIGGEPATRDALRDRSASPRPTWSSTVRCAGRAEAKWWT